MSQIIKDMGMITRCGRNFRTRALEPMGLTAPQARLLMEICATPGESQDALARHLCINKSVVTRMMAALEEQGFVERRVCQKDKRITRLYPTQKAMETEPRIRQLWEECEKDLTRELTAQEVELLRGVMRRMTAQAVKWMEAEQ